MLVSVVIPAYNAEKWVAQTLDSVFKQSYRDLEIIVVDDGSKDNTLSAAEASLRKSPFPWRVFSQENLGAAAARNRGWRSAKGSWVQFLDADDLLASSKIALQIEQVRKKADAHVIYSDWQKLICCDDAWQAADMRTPNIGQEALADILSDRNFTQLGCTLIRSDILRAVDGFDASHEPIEDVGLYVKIAIANGLFVKARSEGPVAWYRDSPRSLSKKNHVRFIESCIKNAKLAEEYVQLCQIPDERTVDAIVDIYYSGTRFFAGSDWPRFEEVLCDIRKLRPDFVPGAPRQIKLLSRIAGYRNAERAAVIYRRGKSLLRHAGFVNKGREQEP